MSRARVHTRGRGFAGCAFRHEPLEPGPDTLGTDAPPGNRGRALEETPMIRRSGSALVFVVLGGVASLSACEDSADVIQRAGTGGSGTPDSGDTGGTGGADASTGGRCGDASPGDRTCDGVKVRLCDVAGLGWFDLETCPHLCTAGYCTGECGPGTKECGAANVPRVCDAAGHWQDENGCSGATPVCWEGNCVACPATGGPAMVPLVSTPVAYCIDSTEVTRDQYAAWLAGSPTTAGQEAWCSWNTDFAPEAICMGSSSVCQGIGCGEHPVVCVDWCDASAYCKAVGKRLCGKIGGGPVNSCGCCMPTAGDCDDPTKSQWFNACTSGGQKEYPYGNTLDGNACNVGGGTTTAAGSLSTCQSSTSGFEGVFDLVGNVFEWEDSCGGNSGSSDPCFPHGGAFDWSGGCGYFADIFARDSRSEYVGFRCCAF